MKKLFLAVAILASLVSFAKGQTIGDLTIVKAVAPPSLVPTATSASVYLTVQNSGASADALVGVSTPLAEMAMLHETVIENDVATMPHVMRIEVPADGMLDMKPGGLHVMLTGLAAPLKLGDVVPLELAFEKAGLVKVEAVVAKPAN
jgi:periplasmic copper chaperone A